MAAEAWGEPVICECVGCTRFASRNVAGRLVCNECYNRNGHLFFPWPKPKSLFERHPRLRDALYVLLLLYILGGLAVFMVATFPKVSCETLIACLFD